MQIVVNIAEEEYESIKKHPHWHSLGELIANGTILPKGHGRLIDEKDLSLMTVHLVDGMFVCDAPTIIEADKN